MRKLMSTSVLTVTTAVKVAAFALSTETLPAARKDEEWYSPELKQAVLLRERLETGLRVRECIGFKLK